jgi:hypothetical protein
MRFSKSSLVDHEPSSTGVGQQTTFAQGCRPLEPCTGHLHPVKPLLLVSL